MKGRILVGASSLRGAPTGAPVFAPPSYAAVETQVSTPVLYMQCRLACCRGVTAAQLIVFLNAICFVAHFSLFTTTLVYLLGWDGKERHLWAPVYRLRANWTDPSVSGYNVDLVENGTGFNIGVFTAVWFGITAGFHLLALVAGTCRPLWTVYFVQLVRGSRPPRPAALTPPTCLRTTPSRGGGGSSTHSLRRSW